MSPHFNTPSSRRPQNAGPREPNTSTAEIATYSSIETMVPSLFQHRAFLSSRSPHIAYPEVVIDVRRTSSGGDDVTGPPLLPKLPRQTTVPSALTPHVCPFPAMTSMNCGIGVGVAVGVLVGVGVGTGVAVGVGSSTTAEGVASGVAVTTTS